MCTRHMYTLFIAHFDQLNLTPMVRRKYPEGTNCFRDRLVHMVINSSVDVYLVCVFCCYIEYDTCTMCCFLRVYKTNYLFQV